MLYNVLKMLLNKLCGNNKIILNSLLNRWTFVSIIVRIIEIKESNMSFVFSYWYIVIAICAVLAIGCVVAFIMMDKQDRVMLDEFVANAQKQAEQPAKTEQPEEKVEAKEEVQE